MTKTTGDLCAVHDPGRLAQVVEAIIHLIGIGSETTTADAIGVSQATLNRLRRGQSAQITRTTAIALERAAKQCHAVSHEMGQDLRAAIVSPEAAQYHAGYTAWCDERMSRWQERDGMTWKVGSFLQLVPNDAAPTLQAPLRQEMRRMLWQRVHQEFPEIFRRFGDEMMRRNVDTARQEVAIMRVIEPLLEATQSAYIERSYSELAERERRDFIDAGIKRELILLDREPALTRARRIAEEGADTFAKQEGERALYAHERATVPAIPSSPPGRIVS